ncbi:MAG TPA: bacillithiol biosynthesis BshC [Thermoanaerobaculia bacterium]|jgi:bacillithiol biosynthesis cysteine-adding enzyme BshC|nr:bacillithiol biosynthesis BshC [Thermoanaerobaculia bacterium]
MIPFESMPGIPRLFLAFARGKAGALFPDPPTIDAVEARAREVGGKLAVVAAGQQAGLLGGPLLSLTKAAAAARLAQALEERGTAARAVFWIASEDHDLQEIARATLIVDGAPAEVRLPVPAQSFQPAGTVPIPPEIEKVFAEVRRDPASEEDIVAPFARAWAPGRTFAEAFRDTLAPLFPEGAIEWVDPLEERWRVAVVAFFRRAFGEAAAITGALDGADRRLREAGFEPQVARAEHDFPAFVIEEGVRRKISWDGRTFGVHGRDGRFSPEALADFVSRPAVRPSAAALLRPVLQSHLFPVAAEILGPSELAYHAQTAPLFPVLGIPRPVFLPRPHLFPRGARERRALEALGVADGDLFRLREAARPEPPPVSPRLQALEKDLAERLAALSPEIAAVDPTLAPAAAAAGEKAAHAISRLREKVERAAERRDVERMRRVDTVETFLAPGRVPADRVYGPLTYLLRFGKAFVPALSREAECRTDGARFVEFE